jgi:beta-lactamase regulating signal transducer with metallopeptidase domain
MTATLQKFWQELQSSQLVAVFMDGTLKSLVLLSLACGCCLCWRKAAAATKHLIWFGALAGALCFPLVTPLLPAWQRPLWAVGTRLDAGNQLAVVVAVAPKQATARSAREPGSTPSSTLAAANRASTAGLSLLSTQVKLHWVSAALLVWSAGLVLVLASVLIDRLRLNHLWRHACSRASAESCALLHELCAELRLRRSVTLLQTGRDIMPLTWGSLRPIIVLPACADQWSADRKRVVLLHELAHVKRWDCLTQFIGRIACALYWFNPLAWLAARQMCIERERACDDLVLNAGCKPSRYAEHLFAIAGAFRRAPGMAGMDMARSSQLKTRISLIVEPSRSRRLSPFATVALLLGMCGAVVAIGANQANAPVAILQNSQSLLERQLAQLRAFSAAKLKQSRELAAKAGDQINPEFQRFFDAAINGDSQTVTNMYEAFKRRHPQYSNGTNEPDASLSTPYWSPVLEICLAYDHVIRCDPQYTSLLADGIINSIPPGSIYFGGTDPGRGIPTAFSRSQIDGDPFFTLTQNALADGGYLQYLRETYDGKIYTPTDEDSQQCFGEYSQDAARRLKHDRQFPNESKLIRPGENVRMENGKGAVSGQVAVMSINGLLARMIFDKNPGREFYIEESLPLDWMYPYLAPHGLIIKINREPQAELPDETLTRDRIYWRSLVAGMIGDWLQPDTSVDTVAAFVEKVYVHKDLAGFSGDRAFIENDYAKRLFSKLRSSIAGVYAWRAAHSTNVADSGRMTAEADIAFRQAFALCPYSPEAVFRYATFLVERNRTDDALLIANAALKLDPKKTEIQNLIQRLKDAPAER